MARCIVQESRGSVLRISPLFLQYIFRFLDCLVHARSNQWTEPRNLFSVLPVLDGWIYFPHWSRISEWVRGNHSSKTCSPFCKAFSLLLAFWTPGHNSESVGRHITCMPITSSLGVCCSCLREKNPREGTSQSISLCTSDCTVTSYFTVV